MKFDRLAVDANAAADFLRPDQPTPAPLLQARELILPLFVLAELRLGVARSQQVQLNETRLTQFADACSVVSPDLGTIDHYVDVRNALMRARTAPDNPEKREGLNHDFWLAALCLQHDFPLLTRDRIFHHIADLEVVHW